MQTHWSRFNNILTCLIIVLFLVTGTLADDSACPPRPLIVYSPFTPWFHFYNGSSQYCWDCASCVFIRADETRKQQFGATALVMGFIPSTLRDVSWPERRIVNISQQLPPIVETIVRALGLDPHITTVDGTKQKSLRIMAEGLAVNSSWLARWAYRKEKWVIVAVVWTSGTGLLLSYAALSVMELLSKRSALGCTYPVYVTTWYILAVFPAGVHVFFANRGSQLSATEKMVDQLQPSTTSSSRGQAGRSLDEGQLASSTNNQTERKKATEGTKFDCHCAGEQWFVQFPWALYYILGTLIFTSIMAVTVIEMVAWFLCAMFVTAASKLLGFFICMSFEATGEGRHRLRMSEQKLDDEMNFQYT
ncbi:hypothetical protein CPB83DRAFT_396842 [Crepidotus variabilis]|uniref:Membrane-associated protein n=1 Tax=Crepidotus variabilis TaxID=179855 RepID=A0A9P6JP97_9AGAR|nr:hypothetical protein CPB83DRAFT_396842 [Crepidotus variabilis]